MTQQPWINTATESKTSKILGTSLEDTSSLIRSKCKADAKQNKEKRRKSEYEKNYLKKEKKGKILLMSKVFICSSNVIFLRSRMVITPAESPTGWWLDCYYYYPLRFEKKKKKRKEKKKKKYSRVGGFGATKDKNFEGFWSNSIGSCEAANNFSNTVFASTDWLIN